MKPEDARPDREAQVGALLILASAVIFSTAGLFTGLVGADSWTVLFWRGVFGGIVIAAVVVCQHGAGTLAEVRALGWPGVAAGACSTLGTICFIHSLRLTTVADVTIIYATAPLVAALVAWLWLRQRQSKVTLFASMLAFGGVLFMTGGALSVEHLAGNVLALAMTILIATMMVIMRRHRARSMLPASALSAFAVALLAWPMAEPLQTASSDLFWLAVFGSVQFGLGLLLLTLGSRKLPGPRAALLGNVELPLAPTWAWLVFGTIPTAGTWFGGAVVTLALLMDLVVSPWSGQRQPGLVLGRQVEKQ